MYRPSGLITWGMPRKGVENADLAANVTSGQRFDSYEGLWKLGAGFQALGPAKFRVVLMDFGAKKNILRNLAAIGANVTVVPANTKAEEILALNPDGVFLSNGPGDPEPCDYAISAIKEIVDTGTPVFGICLGHQLIALSQGVGTVKMFNGHRGVNHPVLNLLTGKGEITSQNHGFTLDPVSAEDTPGVTITHKNLNDASVAGIALEGKPVFSVQYHPEASAGPHDARYLFDQFVQNLKIARNTPASADGHSVSSQSNN